MFDAEFFKIECDTRRKGIAAEGFSADTGTARRPKTEILACRLQPSNLPRMLGIEVGESHSQYAEEETWQRLMP